MEKRINIKSIKEIIDLLREVIILLELIRSIVFIL